MSKSFPLVALGSAGVAVLDCEHRTPVGQVEGHPYIAIPDISDGRVNLSTCRQISDADLLSWTRRTRPRPGDIIVTRRGRVGDTAPVPARVECAIGQNLVLLRSDESHIDQGFLRWATRGPMWRAEVSRLINVGAVFSSLNVGDIPKMRIPKPELRDQVAIAKTLDALDGKVVANNRTASVAAALAQALFERAVGSVDEWLRLGEVATTVLGGTPSRARADYWTRGTVPWITSGKANEERVLIASELITEEALDNSAAKLMPRGATIVAITGATLGQVARLEIESAGNQSLVGIWHDKYEINDWIYFAVRQEIDQLLKHATGAAQQHVNKGAVEALKIPMPPPGVLVAWGKHVRPLLDLAAAVDRESMRLAATRDEILPLLLSGRVQVGEAEKIVEGVA